jgi:hypothetical protein
MMLSIDSLKKLITYNPGINNPKLAETYGDSCAKVQRWINKLYKLREDDGKETWLFKQKLYGRNVYFTRVYARENNIPEVILKPQDRKEENAKYYVRKKEEAIAVRRLSIACWPAPKRLIT